jgi:site-specific recombinase XerD
LSPSVRKNIEDYLYTVRNYLAKPSKPDHAFMLTNYGVRMSLESIHMKVKQMAKFSGIEKPISCHRLRHAIATHLLGEFNLQEIALFLGHKSLDSTQIYTHIKYTKNPQHQ